MPTTRRTALRDTMAAVYGLLNVSTLTSQATGGVHHGAAPPNEVRNYVVLQPPSAVPWDAMQSPGEATEFGVAAVSQHPDYGPALALAAIVVQLLDGERPAITNHLCVALQWQGTVPFQEPTLINGVPTWRAVARFRALVDQTS
jgi:hypothetical protein